MSVVYQCNRCEQTFTDRLELVIHFWLVHKVAISEAEKETDSLSYSGTDSGCAEASEKLGYPSSCRSCPFRKCVLEGRRRGVRRGLRERNRDLRKLHRKGTTIAGIAAIYNVSVRTVQRAVKGVKANA